MQTSSGGGGGAARLEQTGQQRNLGRFLYSLSPPESPAAQRTAATAPVTRMPDQPLAPPVGVVAPTVAPSADNSSNNAAATQADLHAAQTRAQTKASLAQDAKDASKTALTLATTEYYRTPAGGAIVAGGYGSRLRAVPALDTHTHPDTPPAHGSLGADQHADAPPVDDSSTSLVRSRTPRNRLRLHRTSVDNKAAAGGFGSAAGRYGIYLIC